MNMFHVLDILKISLSNQLRWFGYFNSSYSKSSSSQQTDIDIYCRIIEIRVGSIFINLVDPKEIIRNSFTSLVIQVIPENYVPINLLNKSK